VGQPFIGEIRMFGFNFEVAGWAFCDGRLMAISENDALFTRIGTTYGGDGETTFALPNLSSRFPMHQGNNFIIGEMGGTEQETLTVQRIPVHTHPFLASEAIANQPTPGGNLTGQASALSWYRESGGTVVPMAPEVLTPTGGSQPHDNMHPYLAISFQISLFGIFPNP